MVVTRQGTEVGRGSLNVWCVSLTHVSAGAGEAPSDGELLQVFAKVGYRGNSVLDRRTFIAILRGLKTAWLEGQADREADTREAFSVACGDTDSDAKVRDPWASFGVDLCARLPPLMTECGESACKAIACTLVERQDGARKGHMHRIVQLSLFLLFSFSPFFWRT